MAVSCFCVVFEVYLFHLSNYPRLSIEVISVSRVSLHSIPDHSADEPLRGSRIVGRRIKIQRSSTALGETQGGPIPSPWITRLPSIQRDFIPGIGDCVDLAILAVGWDKDRARELRGEGNIGMKDPG